MTWNHSAVEDFHLPEVRSGSMKSPLRGTVYLNSQIEFQVVGVCWGLVMATALLSDSEWCQVFTVQLWEVNSASGLVSLFVAGLKHEMAM